MATDFQNYADNLPDYVRPETAPRRMGSIGEIGGVDFGVAGVVLARNGGRLLVWRPGHTGSQHRGERSYCPSCLQIIGVPGRLSIDLFRGGRFSWRRIHQSHLDQIKEHLVWPDFDARYISNGRTAVKK